MMAQLLHESVVAKAAKRKRSVEHVSTSENRLMSDAPVLARIPAMFSPRESRACKQLVLIRHAATQGYHIIDTPLSESGCAGASQLDTSLFSNCQCVVTSPLTRALHTAVQGIHGRMLHVAGQKPILLHLGPSDGSIPPPSSSTGTSSRSLPVYVTPLAAEKTATLGDVGRNPGHLLSVQALQPVHAALRDVPDYWWRWEERDQWGGAASTVRKHVDKSDDEVEEVVAGGAATSTVPHALSGTASSPSKSGGIPWERWESNAHFKRRVGRLRDFLRALPHTHIVLVAHAETLKELSQSSRRLDYCGSMSLMLLM